MVSSNGGGALAGYQVPDPVDYDSEEDRERSAWQWQSPADSPVTTLEGQLVGDGLQSQDTVLLKDGNCKTESLALAPGETSENFQSSKNSTSLGLSRNDQDPFVKAEQQIQEDSAFVADKEGSDDAKAVVIVEGYQPFSLEDRRPVLVHSVPSRGLSFQLWPAAEALCHYLETTYAAGKGLRGLRVLELGAGTGLVGIFAARLGAVVTLTDLPGVLENLRANVALSQGVTASFAGQVGDSNGDEQGTVSGAGQGTGCKETGKDCTNDPQLTQGCVLGASRGGLGECECNTRFRREGNEEASDLATDVGELGAVLCPDSGRVESDLRESTCGAPSPGRVSVEPLSWGVKQDVDALVCQKRAFDLILASDVVYYDTLFEPLLQSLRWLTAASTSDSLVGTRGSDLSKFQEAGGRNEVDADEHVLEHEAGADLKARVGGIQHSSKQIVLIAHLRRWKKDVKFFRKASKYFDVRLVHSHPPLEGARKGVEVFELVAKGNQGLKSKDYSCH